MRRIVLALLLVLPFAAHTQTNVIHPGDPWLDNRSQQIQAHGGGILHHNGVYFWFGEDRSTDLPEGTRAIACYASTDLVHWTFRKRVFTASSVDGVKDGLIIERPKVFYNDRTHRFVLYAHLDGPADGKKYGVARVMVGVSKKVDGPYTFVKSFRPLDQESRDIGQFVDDDGSAYIIFESRPPKGFFIAKLSDDYLSVLPLTQGGSFIHTSLEGGAIVHIGSLYYVIGSHLTSWAPNPNVVATATSLAGPWTEFKNIAPPEANTYSAQSTFLLKVTGTKTTSILFMGDIWKPDTLWDSRYLWMPMALQNGTLHLPPPHPWTIDAKTGEAKILP